MKPLEPGFDAIELVLRSGPRFTSLERYRVGSRPSASTQGACRSGRSDCADASPLRGIHGGDSGTRCFYWRNSRLFCQNAVRAGRRQRHCLHPSRRKSPAKTKRLIVKYNGFTMAGEFRVQAQRCAPRTGANNNEHQCVGAALVAALVLPARRAPTGGAPTGRRRTHQAKGWRNSGISISRII
jgi:hypothetical protein